GRLKIQFKVVSRKPSKDQISYNDLTKKIIEEHTIIINCTPLGTFPNIDNSPDIPYKYLNNNHLLYDLIYNPAKTTFLAEGERKGATIFNGQKMLELQAEKAWEIWNS
ncbi:MAG: shikimate dehydrogenase, partial [Aequorivita sp.]|nr:shikimate dehydrogenase [Aequorivita sp.]